MIPNKPTDPVVLPSDFPDLSKVQKVIVYALADVLSREKSSEDKLVYGRSNFLYKRYYDKTMTIGTFNAILTRLCLKNVINKKNSVLSFDSGITPEMIKKYITLQQDLP
ncbi:MAG: hypothetical protein INQ03_09140 [Candidatus Heimdallarchaeota archaeon]|nr:hypothetical protein [Candidatus Heimdallarchaeota archaeon]